MGLSETIVAAMIGASATVSAAGFQWMKARTSSNVKPRRSALRAALTLLALVLTSAVGGFAYSELRAQGARAEIARLRDEMNGQLQALVIENDRRANDARLLPQTGSSEALVQLAPCVRSGAEGDGPAPICESASISPVTLCTQIPATAERLGVERYSRPLEGSADWQPHASETGTQALDVSFADASPSYAATTDLSAVCVQVWNKDPARAQVARIVVRYRGPQATVRETAVAAR